MTDEDRVQALEYLIGDFKVYAANCLKIRTKDGKLVPFMLNRAQEYIHARLEQQRQERGFVRAVLLKGRQQGGSTLVGGRFYRETSTTPGRRAFIVAHEDKATSNLFDMVKRFHQHNPIAPSTKASNAQELVFGVLDSGYKLATAGSKDVGRSNTAQLLHASEFAYWANAQSHLAGIGNTIPLADGTEIILESTGNGIGGAFHSAWQNAEAGIGDYIPIFVPWAWQAEYRRPLPKSFELSDEDVEYQHAYGLDLEQMAFRQSKIAEYGDGYEWLFDQEYPAVPNLAFQSPTRNPIISPGVVNLAQRETIRMHEAIGPLVIGCDPAEMGDDRTAIVFRRGRLCFRVEFHEKKTPMEVAGFLAEYHRDFQPDAIFVDKIGIGSGIVSRLEELNIPVIGVISGARAQENEVYFNKRAEMWWRMKAWFDDRPCRIPRDMALASDLSAPSIDRNSDGRKMVEKKESMAKRGIRSPDGADALAMTFAEHVNPGIRLGAGSRRTEAATSAGY